MKTIGITTTVPAEVLLAAGYQPVDLNNLFIGDPDPDRLVGIAERAGFPQNCCTWIKGIYGACVDRGIGTVLCVTTGDCSNTVMLMEVLRLQKFRVIPFAYPDVLTRIRCRRACGRWPTPWAPRWRLPRKQGRTWPHVAGSP